MRLVGQMVASLIGMGVVFHVVLGAFHYTWIRRAIATTDDRGRE